jgi:hypothetical protein
MLKTAKSGKMHITEIALENCAENCTSVCAAKKRSNVMIEEGKKIAQ